MKTLLLIVGAVYVMALLGAAFAVAYLFFESMFTERRWSKERRQVRRLYLVRKGQR